MTRIVVISDTHSKHSSLVLPDGDILVHCGDFCGRGQYQDALRFIGWFQSQPHKHKIFIAGNHDLVFEQGSHYDINLLTNILLNTDTHYLNDSGVTICGLNFWGSPVQPRFFNWAFNRDRGEDIKKHWDKIPEGTDFLITHGPPYGILDEAPRVGGFDNVGCKDLLDAVKRIKPRIHAFGHIHYSGGQTFPMVGYPTTCVNASVVDEQYNVCNKPIVLELAEDKQILLVGTY